MIGLELILIPNDVGLNNDRMNLILVPNGVGLNNDRIGVDIDTKRCRISSSCPSDEKYIR